MDPVGRVLDGAADKAEPLKTIEGASMEVQLSAVEPHNMPATSSTPQKKVKLSSGSDIPRDPRLRAKGDPVSLSSSPELHHKVSSGGRDIRHGASSGGEDRHGAVRVDGLGDAGEGNSEEVVAEVSGDVKEATKTNMHGMKYLLWFDISIEGKDSMDPDEEDWGGRVEFGFEEKGFSVDLEDYFLMFEENCSTQTHNCVGRVKGVLFDKIPLVLKPPDYDTRDIIHLVERYGDAHILDSGWREVDPEEWYDD